MLFGCCFGQAKEAELLEQQPEHVHQNDDDLGRFERGVRGSPASSQSQLREVTVLEVDEVTHAILLCGLNPVRYKLSNYIPV